MAKHRRNDEDDKIDWPPIDMDEPYDEEAVNRWFDSER